MPKASPELTHARREEIIAACETLYQTMGFREITIKEIADYTSFSRPSIYNYFETKEEIFLALLQKEYERWIADLEAVIDAHQSMAPVEIADVLARTLEKREQLLKLMSMNHYDMEANSRMERLTEFKEAYGGSLNAVDRLLRKFRSRAISLTRFRMKSLRVNSLNRSSSLYFLRYSSSVPKSSGMGNMGMMGSESML